MCGICGFSGPANQERLEKMTRSIIHRGPDSAGFYSSGGINMGMRRLKIIDLSTGDQPVFNEDNTVAVVFNGEIYNYRELKTELLARGHRFRSRTDTEVLVHMYEEYGEDFPARLRGMFAFSLWDTKTSTLVLSRDHIGIKPVYYTMEGGQLAFASEIKALLAGGARRELDPQALHYFLNLLYVPAPMSIFKGIKKLPPASTLIMRDGKVSIKKYWSLSPKPAPSRDPRELRAEFLRLFDKLVEEHMLSDVPLGLFLSGGIDSASVLASMHRIGAADIKTFSIGYDNPRDSSYNELAQASLLARHFNTKHTEILVNPDAVSLLPDVAGYFDEPFADSSALVNYLICKHARRDVTVALSGIGGDEAFCGYPRHLGMRFYGLYSRLPQSLRDFASGLAARLPEGTGSRDFSNWSKRFTRGARKGTLDCYLEWTSFLGDRARRIYRPEFARMIEGTDPMSLHREHFAAYPADDPVNAVSMLDMETYLPDDLLVIGDRMSMAASLELRVPFCDVRLLEFAASLPGDLKLSGWRLKSFLKDAVAPSLPPEIMRRRKQGFMIPLGRWLKEDLKPLTRELLAPTSILKCGIFEPAAVTEILQAHYDGRENNSDLIWALLNLELWCRKNGGI
jgi:asparagine synthase (glutamine-hydrolysing)